MQNLLYGISATTLTKCELNSFSHAYNSMFAKIFNSYDNNVISCCQFYSGYLCFELLYDFHRYSFLSQLLLNDFLDRRSMIDIPGYRDYCALQMKYNINCIDSPKLIKHKLWKAFGEKVNMYFQLCNCWIILIWFVLKLVHCTCTVEFGIFC